MAVSLEPKHALAMMELRLWQQIVQTEMVPHAVTPTEPKSAVVVTWVSIMILAITLVPVWSLLQRVVDNETTNHTDGTPELSASGPPERRLKVRLLSAAKPRFYLSFLIDFRGYGRFKTTTEFELRRIEFCLDFFPAQ